MIYQSKRHGVVKKIKDPNEAQEIHCHLTRLGWRLAPQAIYILIALRMPSTFNYIANLSGLNTQELNLLNNHEPVACKSITVRMQ